MSGPVGEPGMRARAYISLTDQLGLAGAEWLAVCAQVDEVLREAGCEVLAAFTALQGEHGTVSASWSVEVDTGELGELRSQLAVVGHDRPGVQVACWAWALPPRPTSWRPGQVDLCGRGFSSWRRHPSGAQAVI